MNRSGIRVLASARRQAGMSLIELMVGMLVGLIGIIIISQMYITNEQYKRSTTGAGSAQVNGAVALYTLERDLRMSGYSINDPRALGCACEPVLFPGCTSALRYYYAGAYSYPPAASAVGALRPQRIGPVFIDETADLPDTITILYGSDSERVTPTNLKQTMSGPNYEYNTDGTAGFDDGNLILVTEGSACALAQITVNAPNSMLLHEAGTFNPAAGDALYLFKRDAAVFNLGSAPVWRRYSIVNNKLSVTDVLNELAVGTTAATQELIDDIVDLQAQYGYAAANDPDRAVVVYNNTTPLTSADWERVYSVRIAVLARSSNYEKGSAPGVCNATAAGQYRWSNVANPLFPRLEAELAKPGSEWGCYKYRAFETIVPLRNMIWRSP